MEVIVLKEEELNKNKFSVNPGTRIKDLKSNIARSKDVSEEHSKLFYMDQVLEDEKTLSDYNISNYSAIILRQYPYYLRIRGMYPYDSFSYDLDIEPESTLLDLKNMIMDHDKHFYENMQADINDITLYASDRFLDDDYRTIGDYKLKCGSTIKMKIEDYTGTISILVRTSVGSRFQIEAKQTDTIRDLKLKIQEREGIPPNRQHIIYCGRHIGDDDDKTVHDCKIKRDAVIHLVSGH